MKLSHKNTEATPGGHLHKVRRPFWKHTIFYHWWTTFHRWRYFKFTLPRVVQTTVEGIHLNLTGMPPAVKNHVLKGHYKVAARRQVVRFLTAEDRVLELGSGIGFLGLYCQLRLGIRHYAGVEADPATIHLADENYASNGHVPHLIQATLASGEGTLSLRPASPVTLDHPPKPATPTASPVAPRTLPSLIRDLDFKPTAVIADLGGAEQSLRWDELPASVRTVILDLHPDRLGLPTTYRIIADLVQEGFAVVAEEAGTYAFVRP